MPKINVRCTYYGRKHIMESGKLESGGVGSGVAGVAGVALPPRSGACPQEEYLAVFGCKNVPMMVGKNSQQMTAVLFRPRCKCWSCESCARVNADLWQMRAQVGAQQFIEAGVEMVLVTVTAHEKHDIRRAVEVLPDQWNKLRNRWQRATSKPQYILIPEVGEKGHFHLHLITNGALGTTWWKKKARRSGLGYMAEESERNISASKTGFYVGKYLAKQLHNNIWKRGFHRVRTSQNWPKLPVLARNVDWHFSVIPRELSLVSVLSSLRGDGFSTRMADQRSAWSLIETGETYGTWLPSENREQVDNFEG
jgi:hypothetical protein